MISYKFVQKRNAENIQVTLNMMLNNFLKKYNIDSIDFSEESTKYRQYDKAVGFQD